jgi:hypothetical protein
VHALCVCDDDSDYGENHNDSAHEKDASEGHLCSRIQPDSYYQDDRQTDDHGVRDDVECGAHSETDNGELDIMRRFARSCEPKLADVSIQPPPSMEAYQE